MFSLNQVMLACGKYNLVHDFFKKVQKSSIPNALTYRGILWDFTGLLSHFTFCYRGINFDGSL